MTTKPSLFKFTSILLVLCLAGFNFIPLLLLKPETEQVLTRMHVRGGSVLGSESRLNSYQQFRYKRAAYKFPDYSSCVVTRKNEAETIAWRKLKHIYHAEVCLWHFADQFENVDELVNWFQRQGLKANTSDKFTKLPRDDGFTLLGSIPRESKNFPKRLSYGWFRILTIGVNGISISVEYDGEINPKRVSFIFNRL